MHTDENAPDPTAVPAPVIAPPAEEPAPEPSPEPEPASCRHCGAQVSGVPEGDWPCPECGRYQDSMICPMCKQIARISLMPADVIPEPHAPQRRRKAKE